MTSDMATLAGPPPERSSSADPATPQAAERILRAALDGLAELDPAALSIQRICKEAAVTPPTVYYHYGSKDGLIAAAVERLVADWLARLDAFVPRVVSLDETLDLAVQGWEAMITSPSRPIAVFLWVALWTTGTSQESRSALLRARSRGEEMLRDGVAGWLGTGDDVADLAALIVDGIIAAAVGYQLDHDTGALRRRLITLTRVTRTMVDAAPLSASARAVGALTSERVPEPVRLPAR